VQSASAALENTVIRAPADGTITTVDIKVGEQATPAKAVIVLQDVGNLHVEANVSEANIAQVKIGQEVTFTFDALGPDREFTGTVQTIDPSSTVISGVVNYKVTASVEKLPEIKPGMTANMTILTATKTDVLTIPQRAVLTHDSKKFVRVVDDKKKKTYHEVEVTTGLEADGGLTELLSGLESGQEIVTFINSK
jgi:HlyD family secretion protein